MNIFALHDHIGLNLYTLLCDTIFDTEGYYTNWTEREIKIFALTYRTSIEFVNELIETCFVEDVFSRDMYDSHRILTSVDVQENFLRIVKAQKWANVRIDPKFNLLKTTEEPIPEFSENDLGITAEISQKISYSKGKGKSKEEIVKQSFGKESECANAHTHTREEKIPVFENSVFSEKKLNEPAEAQKQMLVAEKKGKEKNCAQKEKIEKVQVRERVHLKQAEIEQLKRELGEEDYNFVVDKVDLYKGAKGKKYQDDFCAIRGWGFAALTEHKAKTANLNAQKEKKKGAKACIGVFERLERKYSNSTYA